MQNNIVKFAIHNKINYIKSHFIIPSIFTKCNVILVYLQDIIKENNKNVENEYMKFVNVQDTPIK